MPLEKYRLAFVAFKMILPAVKIHGNSEMQ